MAEAAVGAALFLIEKVCSILVKEVNLKKELLDGIEDVRIWLKTIRAYLKDMDGKIGGSLHIERSNQLRDIAHDIEDVLDDFLLHSPVSHRSDRHTISKIVHGAAHSVKNRLALHKLSSRIEDIKKKKDNFVNFDPRRQLGEGPSSDAMVEDNHAVISQIPERDEIVGFEDHKSKLIQQLLEGREARRKTISVVGSAGSGKSVLVKSVYEDESVVEQYDSHAWIHVSRSFKIDELLWRMLGQFCKGQEELCPPGRNVQEKVKTRLQKGRYLVVLDDVWSIDDWERIVDALPSGFGGSTIIVTTRNSNVASSCVQYPELYVHELKGLSWPYDWQLFCKKAFSTCNKVCPKELVKLSQNILAKCEGLPFAIASIGSLLSTKEKTPAEFQKLYESLGSEIEAGSNLSKIGKILLPSYRDLSDKDNLKSCLLCFSIFPEDYSIKRGRLIQLWIAEGLIPEKRGKTMEMVAEEYLNELIARNLVNVSLRDFDRRVSSCRLLNLVREFIIQKSEEENFVKILAEPSTGASQRVRRLSVQSKLSPVDGFKDLDLSRIRTLFMFDWHSSFSSNIGKFLGQFWLLRVLDMEGAPLQTFPKGIAKLTLLKYLSLRGTKIDRVPKFIKKLAYLETLNLKHTNVIRLPSEIRELRFLRHLLVYRYNVRKYVAFDSIQGVEVPAAGIGGLSKLQKLSLLRVNKEVIEELGALIHLKKLGILGLKEEDGEKLCTSVTKMQGLLSLDVSSTGPGEYLDLDSMVDHPRFLQRVLLKGRLAKLPGWISSLDSLVRIYLKWSRLNTDCDNPLRALENLPNLLELEMVDSYMGEALEFMANTFKKLKILHLEDFDCLNMVVVQENAMPKLEKLTICKCKKLEMLPLGISYLTHLKELLVYDMEESFINCLNKDSEYRCMVDHIKIIHSFTLDSNQSWSFHNHSRFSLH